ncbi:cell division protein FtsQ/DivIB [Snodgrassella sp. CFCC 13594]|uniref:cell division protein FtsQ/DivIB n=1 Tax=Snodgrassella sp. CFCC 13594 TaxID=1775559 RepID=UPI0009EF3D1F|nr:cell division protein FtsQ/DivIB [Snodgrassella sp. CFCC 13594]
MRLWDNAPALRRLYRWLYACVIVCLLASLGVWVVNSPYFPIKQVKVVKPVQHISAQQLQAITQQYLHGNIFKANVSGAQAVLAKLPWVAKVQVKRLWPDTVAIDITERVPVAHWHDGQLVDNEGNVFNATTNQSLPVFTGSAGLPKMMVPQLLEFERILQPTGLHITQLDLSDRSAWDVMLDNGISVRLGSSDGPQRLTHFVWAWPQVLKEQAGRVNYVDMRYKDGFAVGHKSAGSVQTDGNIPATAASATDTQATQAAQAAQTAD